MQRIKPKLLSISLIIFISTLLITACGFGSSNSQSSYTLDDVNKEVPASTDSFGWELFSDVFDEEENKLISPLSISVALAMTAAGADGETNQEMLEVLSLHGLDEETIHQSFRALTDILEHSDPEVELSIANSIWKRDHMIFEETFLQKLENYFNAEIDDLTTAEEINGWIENETDGLIDELIDEIPSNVVMYLINAIYFYGGWSEPFEENLTTEEQFTISNGETIKAMLMQKQEPEYLYLSDDHFQAVSLPYGEEERWSMDVILPNEEATISDVINVLKGNGTSMSYTEKTGQFRLPKFSFQDEMALNDPLIELGMPLAFDPSQADFSRMTAGGGLFISEVLHKTFIEVDEKGTEAAAVTSVAMSESAEMPEFEMIVDRPFLFIIRDNLTDTLLFIGYVENPNAE